MGWWTVSSVPMYLQVSEQLRRLIRSGEWPPGHALPSQAELTAQYGVSVVTVRSAVAVLRSEGLVVTRQGLGSFVRGDLPGATTLGTSVAPELTVTHLERRWCGDGPDGKAVESVQARMPTPQEAQEQHIVAGVPVLVVTRRALAANGKPAAKSTSTVLAADRAVFNYVVTLDTA
jgi:GntR family transcriptional regulator